MSPLEDALTRVVARQLGRALPVRQTSSLALDPMNTIGVVTIKIVTEEQIQAIAYGRLGEEPNVIVRLDPIGRDVTDLLPFARFMARVAETALEHGQLRVWVPHSGALEALDILGHRYWRNQSAPPEIVRMGEVCRIIAHEATFPGQQLVANAADMLRSHLITGLCPLEEGHLDALLAWLDPAVINPLLEARERIRVPASGILPNTPDQPLDDRVDRLRRIWKSSRGSRRSVAETEIRRILRAAVLREWQILAQARDAFLRLALPATGLGALVKASQARIQYSLESGYFPARSADRLAVQFDEMEAGQQLIDLAALENDPSVRERARHAGEVIGGVVTRVLQPKPSFKPCSLEIDSPQARVRCRRDDKIKLVGTNVTGVIRHIEGIQGGGTRLRVEITSGVRSRAVLTVGANVEVMDAGFGYVRVKAFIGARQRQPWIFYDTAAPVLPRPTRIPRRSPVAIAASRRRP